MKSISLKRHHIGFVLLEALVSILVLGVGVLAVAKFNGSLLQGTGVAKTRSEALQMAQQRLEDARNTVATQGCGTSASPTLANQSGSQNGVNASYTISTAYSNFQTDSSGKRIRGDVSVTVTWPDNDSDPNNNQIVLKSVINCTDVSSQARTGKDGLSLGNFIKNPTGRGTIGGENYGANVPAGATNNTISGTSINDGTKTNVTADGRVELIDASGRVQLKFNKTDCEKGQSNTGFSTISGILFVGAKNGNPIADDADLFVLSSDASYCAKLPYNVSQVLPAGATENNIKYFYTYYQCYLGPEWWGNIGTVRTGSANNNDRSCMGHGTTSAISGLFSTIPQMSSARGYRGYKEVSTGIYESQGIGVKPVSPSAPCGYTAEHYINHHLVLTNITGQSNCSTKVNETVISGSLGSNPGRFFCMSPDTCPDLSNPITPRSTLLHGTITRPNTSVGLCGIDASTACSTSSLTASGTTSYSYSCQIDWTGFTASSWYGNIGFLTTGGTCTSPGFPNTTLCQVSGSGVTVTPTGTAVAYNVNDINAEYPNSISFTDIPMSVTNVTLNLTLDNLNCGGRLGTPNVSWGTTGSQPRSLLWSAVTGATTYKILRCQVSGVTTYSACTPATLTTATNTSVSPGSLNLNDVVCMNVQATGSGGSDSLLSPTKCIHRVGNNKYDYY